MTDDIKIMYPKLDVSIHTPAWGVTTTGSSALPISAVSIHTPAWGVTKCKSNEKRMAKCFNPHARVGRDSKCLNG